MRKCKCTGGDSRGGNWLVCVGGGISFSLKHISSSILKTLYRLESDVTLSCDVEFCTKAALSFFSLAFSGQALAVPYNWAPGYKTLFMLSSAEHEILNAHEYKNIKKFSFLGSHKARMLFFPLIMLKCQQLLAF